MEEQIEKERHFERIREKIEREYTLALEQKTAIKKMYETRKLK